MERWLFTFFIGAIFSLLLPIVPDFSQLLICFCFAVTFCFIKELRSYSGLLFGCLWLLSAGYSYQNIWQINELTLADFVGKTIIVKGKVANIATTLISTTKHRTQDESVTTSVSRFNFVVEEFNGKTLRRNINIRLRWQQKIPVTNSINNIEVIRQGQTRLLKVRIKPAHGFANVGGFSYQAWLRQKQLHATGYVKHANENKLILQQTSLRQQLYLQLESLLKPLLSNNQLDHFVYALTFGERGKINTEQWQVLQATGTQHLMAISGLHLGLIASGAFAAMLILFRVMPFHLLLSQRGAAWLVSNNNRIIAFVLSSLFAIFYAYLAGFSLPTLRALIMLLIFIGAKLLAVKLTLTRWLLLSVVAIILLSPFSLFSVSFWLSIYAVTLILLIIWRCRQLTAAAGNSRFNKLTVWFHSLIIVQLGLTLFMLPVAALLNHQLPLTALLANIIAVPWMSFTAIPLCLLSVVVMPFSEVLASFLLQLSLMALKVIWLWLDYLAGKQTLYLDVSHESLTVILIVSCLVFISYFLALPKKVVATFSLLLTSSVFAYFAQPLKRNDWQVNILDVGQGLAVVIERNGQAILYDTGASYPSGFNLVESVVLPYFQYRGINTLDYLILSHTDNDHAGGLAYIDKQIGLNKISVKQVRFNSEAADLNNLPVINSCKQGDVFVWQGLTFSVLWPVVIQEKENDNSCVINVSDGQHSVLLTGDISRKVEKTLVANPEVAKNLSADVIIAPHHGSKTSSSVDFIAAVAPEAVVFSAGYLNRWHMPNAAVLKRYQQFNITPYSTAMQGMIQINVSEQALEIMTYRDHIKPNWFTN